jgi:pilus assembly protein CpaB
MAKKLIAALGLALVSLVALWLYARSVEADVAGGRKLPVLVAAEELAAGQRVQRVQLAVREVPEAYVHQASIQKGDETQIIGRPVADKIAQGQPLLWSDFELGKSSASRRLSAALPKGQRAFTLPVDASASLAGLLRPGDHIDIMGTFARAQSDFATVTLLQNVLVLATGVERSDGEGDAAAPAGNGAHGGFGTITVATDPEAAELLAFAAQRGPISVSLRAQDDAATFDDVPEKNFGDIFEPKRRSEFARRHVGKPLLTELKAQ